MTQAPRGEVSDLAHCLGARAGLNLKLELFPRAESDARAALNLEGAADRPAERTPLWLTLAASLEGDRRLPAADTASDSALSQAFAIQPADTSLKVEALLLRGRVLTNLKRPAEAEPLFAAAVAQCPGDARTNKRLQSQSLLGWCMMRQQRYEEAEPVLLHAYAGLSGRLAVEDPMVRAAALRLAELYEKLKEPDLFAHYQSIAVPKVASEDEEPEW